MVPGIAAEWDPPAPPSKPAPRVGKGYDMDYGPALSYTINCRKPGSAGPDNLVLKGVAVHLQNFTTVCFDTERLRYAAFWTNGFLDISRTHLNSSKGSDFAWADGEVQFSTSAVEGWQTMPVSGSKSRYRGYYRNGARIVFSCVVEGTEVLDSPSTESIDGTVAFCRTLSLDAHRAALRVLISTFATDSWETNGSLVAMAVNGGEREFATIQTSKPSAGVALRPSNKVLYADFSPSTERTLVRILLTKSAVPALPALNENLVDPGEGCRGGPSLWPQVLETKGQLSESSASYVTDNLLPPESNPWRSWLRFTALDFFSDGRAAIATWSGDVWIVSGIDRSLRNLRWKRFAAGLFEALGLKIVNDTVYVTSRDRIVRLHDLNGDEEADFYESFNSDAAVGPSYHAFAFDLQTDSAGNFYYIRCGQRVDPALPLQGGMLKVSADGRRTEEIAFGLRAANGMAVGPHDEIVCSDNQGNWTPSSRINWITREKFYGFVPHAHMAEPPKDYEKPLCWLPMTVDNSSGGESWVTSRQWGPFENYLLHTSYGKAGLFLVLTQQINSSMQGAVVQFPLKFESGIMRARFGPNDGQLYVCGLQGWQTSGLREGCFQRVRFTGAPVRMPSRFAALKTGLELTFTCKLDPKTAGDIQNYSVEAWNYRWTQAYGSPEYSVANPNAQRHDRWTVSSATLLADQKTVRLGIPEFQPVMQLRVETRLRDADAAPLNAVVYGTVNTLP